MSKSFTYDEKIEIRKLYRNALNSSKQIKILSELYDCNISDIKAVLFEQNGIQNSSDGISFVNGRIKWTPSAVSKLRQFRLDGKTYSQIAQILGVSPSTIAKACKRHGICSK